MKNLLTILLAFIAIILGVALFLTKSGDNTQITGLNTSLADCSNRLDTATAQLSAREADLLSLSNQLATANAAVSDSSHRLTQIQNDLDGQKQQSAKLATQLADLQSQEDALNHAYASATNQVVALTLLQQSTEVKLEQTHAALSQQQNDFAVLGRRLQEDVAARLVLERRWRSPSALHEKLDSLKYSPESTITPERIYADLNVEVAADGTVRVLTSE
jgi:chromosome segregation ATPase